MTNEGQLKAQLTNCCDLIMWYVQFHLIQTGKARTVLQPQGCPKHYSQE